MRFVNHQEDVFEIRRENICEWSFDSLVDYYSRTKWPETAIHILLHLHYCQKTAREWATPEWFAEKFGKPMHHEENAEGDLDMFYSFTDGHVVVIRFQHERFVEFFTNSTKEFVRQGMLFAEITDWSARLPRGAA